MPVCFLAKSGTGLFFLCMLIFVSVLHLVLLGHPRIDLVA